MLTIFRVQAGSMTGCDSHHRHLTRVISGDSVDVGAFELNDQDFDGVDTLVEDHGPNSGDGNNDGVPDSRQANVASLPNATDGSYVSVSN